MTVNRRAAMREKRLERERRRRYPVTCHVCGHTGPRKSMMVRDERWCCRSIPACTERVMNPPPVRLRASRPGTCRYHGMDPDPACPVCFPQIHTGRYA